MKSGSKKLTRRRFIKISGSAGAGATIHALAPRIVTSRTQSFGRPNVVFITADQMRAHSLGCMGNTQVNTPHLNRLASEGVRFTHSISNYPVCTPARAMWQTGMYPTSTGVISNDIRLSPDAVTIAKVLKNMDYSTGYIGKWHLDGPDRQGYTPPGPRRQGYDFWAAANICHNYFHAFYYTDTTQKIDIQGYQPDHETELAMQFLEDHQKKRFFLNLHWGPPHDPYTAPELYMKMYDPEKIELRDNVVQCVPNEILPAVRHQITAYHAAISNLDWNIGRLMQTLQDLHLTENTLVAFTSDHGDMLFSLALQFKQWPYDESVRVPLIVRYPERIKAGTVSDALIGTVDLMPTFLSFCGAQIPKGVQGIDFSETILGGMRPDPDSALIMCVQPCARYNDRLGMQPWRGLRTKRHTYARFKEEDWCLYDNENDPFQTRNLFADRYDDPKVKMLRDQLNGQLQQKLHDIGDRFDAPVFPKIRWK